MPHLPHKLTDVKRGGVDTGQSALCVGTGQSVPNGYWKAGSWFQVTRKSELADKLGVMMARSNGCFSTRLKLFSSIAGFVKSPTLRTLYYYIVMHMRARKHAAHGWHSKFKTLMAASQQNACLNGAPES